MDNEELGAILNRLDTEIIAPLTRRLAKHLVYLDRDSLTPFSRVALSLCEEANDAFITMLGVRSHDDIEPSLGTQGMFLIIVRLNDMLPEDFPYCIAAIYI